MESLFNVLQIAVTKKEALDYRMSYERNLHKQKCPGLNSRKLYDE